MAVQHVGFSGPGTLLSSLSSGASLERGIRVGAVLFVTALTVIAAQVSVPLPFTPVPLTLQPMVVLLGGVALGARLGMASQLLYLLLGIAGLPVFAASPVLPQGILRILGPTGGYLMAYPLAAFVTGSLAERGFDRTYLRSFLAMAAGLVVLFAGGVTWLAWFARPVHQGFDAALRAGLYPFVLPDLIKIAIASGIMPAVWSLLGRRSS